MARPKLGPGSNGVSTGVLEDIRNSRSASILAYCLASISMTVVNKYVVSGDGWNLNLFYIAVQSSFGTMTILACRQIGWIQNLTPWNMEKARKCFHLSLLLVSMIYTANKALRFLSLPVYTIFKNLTIIVIAYGEVLWFGGSVSQLALASFGLIVLSSMVAAWADIQYAISVASIKSSQSSSATSVATLNAGFAWMLLNVFISAAYALTMRKFTKKTEFSNWDIMYYNNFLSVPVLAVTSLLLEDWSTANVHRNFPPETRQSLLVGMVYSGIGAIGISYCTAWCVRATSSTTYAMVGALNKLPLAVCGIVFFASPVTVGSVSAIALGFFSGCVYTLAKIRSVQESQATLPFSNPPPKEG